MATRGWRNGFSDVVAAIRGTLADAGNAGSISVANFNRLSTLGADWFFTAGDLIRGVVPTLTTCPLRSDCQDMTFLEAAVTGTGVAAPLAGATGGQITVSSGATAGGIGNLRNAGSATIGLVPNLRTSKYALASRARLVTLPTGAGGFFLARMSDLGASNVGFLVIPSFNPTNYVAICGGAFADTGVPFGTTTSRSFYVVADGANVRYYIDGTLVATVTQLGAAVAAGRVDCNAYNAATAEVVSFHVDKLAVFTEAPT